ncbi:MAG TPA: phosphatase PAP2 family protein [Polyangiaceae bacterium]|nr:phosphatase PAP2 family protein [Polyangiaceae bacterium]
MRKSAVGLAICWLLRSAPASAEPRELSETQSARYYYTAGGLTLAGFGLSGLAWTLFRDVPRGPVWGRFYPDDLVERNFSAAAARLSDQLLVTSLSMPLIFEFSHGFDVTSANAALVQAQTASLNSLLSMTAKLAVRRPRPYTHSKDPRVQQFARDVGADASLSFFSGHSSASFSSATAGSILYSSRTELKWSRYTLWGLSHSVAGFTAQLRMCAGRHYRTDIWTGSVVGVGMGVLVPWLNGIDLSRVHDAEVALAAGAGVLTMGLTEALGFCELMQRIGVRDLPAPDVLAPVDLPGESEEGAKKHPPVPPKPSLPEEPEEPSEAPPEAPKPSPPEARWFLLPAVLDGGVGVLFFGEL